MWIWIVLGIIGCILIAVLIAACTNIDIKILFNKVEKDDYLSIKVRMLFGLVKFNYQIRQIKFKGFDQGFLLKREKQDNLLPGHDSREHIDLNLDFIQHIYDQISLIIRYTADIKHWVTKLLRRVRCDVLTWNTHVGFGDVVETGMASGIIWAVKGTVTGWLSHTIRLEHMPGLEVHTHFNDPQFTTELRCIAKIRFGHAMIAGVILLVRIVKVKGGLKLWQSILFKA